MTKILFLANKDNVIYNFRKEVVFALLDKGCKVVLSCPYGKKIDFLTERGAQFRDLDIDRRGTSVWNDLKLIKAYYKLIKSEKPDVVLTYTTKCSVFGGLVCRWLKAPYIVNNAGLIETTSYNKVIAIVLNLLYKWGFMGAACMMYQNGRERDFVNNILNKKVCYRDIPGSGVNLSEFVKKPYPSTEEVIRFNYVARIVKFKGIEEFLACAERIKKEYPKTEFVIYGDFDDDSYRGKIQQLVKDGIVKYGGIQLDMKPCIEKAHAVIHSSYYEGITNVILEHAAIGRPAIVSDIPGCREAIDTGISGYSFPLQDVDSLVNKVKQFIELPYKAKMEMGKRARLKMEREFDRNIVINIYLEEIDRILNA